MYKIVQVHFLIQVYLDSACLLQGGIQLENLSHTSFPRPLMFNLYKCFMNYSVFKKKSSSYISIFCLVRGLNVH